MKRLVGISKWFELRRAVRWKYFRNLPLGFVAFLFGLMRFEKLTRIGGRTFVNTNYAPFPSEAYDTVLEDLVRISEGEHRLLSFCVGATKLCPMNCIYCSAKTFTNSDDMSTDRMICLVREAQDLGAFVIGFSGGEPLLRQELPDIIKAVDDRSVTMLFTSGWRFPEKSAALREAGLDIVVVSLDTFDEAVNNKRRGHESATETAVEATRAAARAGFYTVLSMVPDKSMLDEAALADYLQKADVLGVHEVRILAPRPCVTYEGNRLECFNAEQLKCLRRLQAIFNKRRRFPAVMSLEHTESEANQGCHGGKTHCYVSPSGEITPCDFFPVSFGNVRGRPLAEVYATMRHFLPQPSSRCALAKVFDLISQKTPGTLPVRDLREVKALFEKLSAEEETVPAFFRKLQGKKIR